jgi:hypothetical protein
MKNQFRFACFCIFGLLFSYTALADGEGYIQVECKTDADVYLDGNKVGSTSPTQASLVIEAKAGRHNLDIKKLGFQTQSFSVTVEVAQVKQIKVAPFRPVISVGESGDSDNKTIELVVGSLRLQTVPIECTIDISQLKINQSQKKKADWFVKDVPVGNYNVTVSGIIPTENGVMKSKSRLVRVPVLAKRETYFLVNIITGEVKDIPAERLLAKANEYAEKGKRDSDFNAWQEAIRYASLAITTSHIEPKGARTLKDLATKVLADHQKVLDGQQKDIDSNKIKRTNNQSFIINAPALNSGWKRIMRAEPGKYGETKKVLLDKDNKKYTLKIEVWANNETTLLESNGAISTYLMKEHNSKSTFKFYMNDKQIGSFTRTGHWKWSYTSNVLGKKSDNKYSLKDGNENQSFSRTLETYPVRIKLSKADTLFSSISIKAELETLPEALP